MVFGEPDIDLKKQKDGKVVAEIRGVHVYDPTTGAVRSHGTDDIASLGTAASHGCIRMSIPDVIQLYKVVPVGTRVYIV